MEWPVESICGSDQHRYQIFGMVKIHFLHLGPLHTRDWQPVTITLQALSLVEKAEPVQVRFTLRLRDQQREYVNARWM